MLSHNKFTPKDFDFSAYGAFIAFTEEQFNEQAEGVREDYINVVSDLFAPKDKASKMIHAMDEHCKAEYARILEENGKENCILYELHNYECFYTGDISEAVSACKFNYGFTYDEILPVYSKYLTQYEAC